MIREAALLLAAGVLAGPLGGSAYRKTEEGNRRYAAGELEGALGSYTEAQETAPEAPELLYDIGNVLYRQEQFESASDAYERALSAAAPSLAGPAAYNLGNARFRLGAFDEAIEAYRRALRENPDDLDAKRNLELAIAAARQQTSPESSPDGSENEDEGQQEQQEQQEQGQADEGDSEQQESQGEGEQDKPNDASGAEGEGRENEAQSAADPAANGELTPEQAERLLEGIAEQEREGLREGALNKKPRPASSKTDEDW